jgi:hypothetical protein
MRRFWADRHIGLVTQAGKPASLSTEASMAAG